MNDINIGAKVQEFRKLRGLSVRELASRANMTPSMVSQIESNSVNPSINTLKNLASVLNFPLYIFFQEDTPVSDRLVVRKGQYKTIGKGTEVMYKLLTPDVSGTIEFCLMDIPPHSVTADVARSHSGEEDAYVIEGEVSVELNGEKVPLNTGDAVKIPALTPHRWFNETSGSVQVVFAITPPSF